ncbi:hypothetical protein EPUS_05337 [Endocarpon pusillum Z07020]|uniref:Uncharacterized protein n=1 Tax=Endocarpon pusillum (strain Z07020 / HMAS-L-300199) TaxID=1263415 RepID=U1HLX8_ENDPU|nr:uncharacterized protein EPUS_05337 [Endocarpon pusillum Z07020]ERF71285.1 hypothetical protein EPUS_05337 [Endocarpon pusillum Z07020]
MPKRNEKKVKKKKPRAIRNQANTRGKSEQVQSNQVDSKDRHSEENPCDRPGNQDSSTSEDYPIFLPFNTQHLILTILQSTLEDCCQDFGKRWLPQLMEARRWTEPGSIELHVWVRVVSDHWNEIPHQAINQVIGKDWSTTLWAVVNIRHLAVHRRPTSARLILDFLHFAEEFTAMLQDSKSMNCIKTIKNKLNSVVDDLEVKEVLLQEALREDFAEITKKQTLLKKEAVENMKQRSKENITAAGQTITDFLTINSYSSKRILSYSNDDDFNSRKIRAGARGKRPRTLGGGGMEVGQRGRCKSRGIFKTI